jgi:hypothetical protein
MTEKEFINKTIEKFSKVNGLGVNGISPIYGYTNSKSGIGCAIGCHLTGEMADNLDKFCGDYDTYAICDLYDDVYKYLKNYDDDFVAIVNYIVDELFNGIDIEFLKMVQSTHDSCVNHSYNVEELIERLKNV